MKQIIVKIPDVVHSRAINGELTDLDTMFICGAVVQGKTLQTELEEIKAEINEYLIASFADDEDFRWFNLCLDAHIKELSNEKEN